MQRNPGMIDLKNSSTWKFFLYSFTGFLLVIIAVTIFYALSLYRHENKHLKNNLLQVEEVYVPFLVSSLWVTDYDSLEMQIEGIVRFNFIDRVEICDEDDNLFFAGTAADSSHDIVTNKLIYNYRGETREIGTLSLYINKSQMKSVITLNAIYIFVMQFILAFVLSLVIATVFYLVIGKNMIQLARFIKSDDPSKNSSPFVLQRKFIIRDELQILVEHFNSMRQRIREHIAQIQQLSYHDQLTELYNRRFFEEELKRLDTERNLPLSILMIDVNGLKLTNDAFGHAGGDRLLKKVAEVLKRESRADDIIARIGGDEFVVLLPKTDKKHTASLERRLGTAFKNEIIKNIPVSVSCGGATKKQIQEKIENIFKKAEDNMYNQKSYKKDSQRQNSIQIILRTLFEKEPREKEHSERVSKLCAAIGTALEMNREEIDELKAAGKYHDIGKIVVSGDILNKKGTLNSAEWKQIKRHPESSYNILSTANEYGPIAEIILAHHERWDGKGYPAGLKGEEIPFQARIILAADAYDMMTHHGFGRKVMTKEEAIEELKKNMGTQFDPKIVKVFIEKVLADNSI